MSYATRFAPSPTGPLHIGHAYSAWVCSRRTAEHGGRFLLRIEDTDVERSKPEWEALIEEDLAWLGFKWETPVLRQSEHFARYDAAIERLVARDLVYPCSCSRADIAAAASAPQEGAPHGPVYPGTCRGRTMATRQPGDALRLDMARAVEGAGPVQFVETGPEHDGTHAADAQTLIGTAGDIVLARKGSGLISYFVASAIDDDFQGITEVVRGTDLFQFTPVQVLLMQLLGLDVPHYHHHRLIRDDTGKRLAKRDDARALSTYRAEGMTADEVLALVID